MLTVYQDELEPAFTDFVMASGTPVDLTGATAQFRMRRPDSNILAVDAGATVTDAPAGAVEYDWQAGDLDAAGPYVAWLVVTLLDTSVIETAETSLVVLGHGATTSDLCTLYDVREAMGLMDQDTADDQRIVDYIHEASAQIQNEFSRQFAPVEGTEDAPVTKRFKVDMGLRGYRVDFYPYDLQVLTAARLHPESFQLDLDIADEVELRPFVSRDGVYTTMRVSPWRPMVSRHSMRFGKPYVDVSGVWGFASVPLPVRRAAVVAVRSWLRRDQQAFGGGPYGSTDPREVQPTPTATYSLPYASRKLLGPYARWANAV